MRNYFIALAVALVVIAGGYNFAPRSAHDTVAKWFGFNTPEFGQGEFRGDLEVVFFSTRSSDNELVELIMLKKPFGYTDSKGVEWDVPSGYISNGASIPKLLWGVIGGPFSGPYRDAAVLHDYYCEMQDRPWQKVHEMFLEASVSRGTDPELAKILYAGVLIGGPRWDKPKAEFSQSSVKKAQVAPINIVDLFASSAMAQEEEEVPFETQGKSPEEIFKALQEWIKKEKPTKSEIQSMVEKVRKITIKKFQ